MSVYGEFVAARLADGDSPNVIEGHIREELESAATTWELWGDERWHVATCCPVCGSWAPGMCGHHQAPVPKAAYEAGLR